MPNRGLIARDQIEELFGEQLEDLRLRQVEVIAEIEGGEVRKATRETFKHQIRSARHEIAKVSKC